MREAASRFEKRQKRKSRAASSSQDRLRDAKQHNLKTASQRRDAQRRSASC
jgi:hypothetical protein